LTTRQVDGKGSRSIIDEKFFFKYTFNDIHDYV
jgi:hypothetical protein